MNPITNTSERMHVELRLLAEPALWCWDIRDRRSGRIVESSWDTHWIGYDSRDEAAAAGRHHLHRHLQRAASSMSAPMRTQTACERAG